MSRSKQLYKLQELDSEIDQALKRIREIEDIMADDAELQQAFQHEQQKAEIVSSKETALRQAEARVEDQKFKIEKNKAKLYGGKVTNPKELEDLQMESESLHDYLAVLEERQLEAMLALDEAESEHQSAVETYQKIKAAREEMIQELQQEKKELESRIQVLRDKRPTLSADIRKEDLQLYQRLREKMGGVAVAVMADTSCSACGSHIPSALAQKAKSPSSIAQCNTCNRILHPR